MEITARKKTFRWLAIFLLVLIGTNLANYYIFNSKVDQTADLDKPTTIIKYEPMPQALESDIAIIGEAIDSITDHYYYPVETDILIEGAIRGMIVNIGDPYLRYFNPEDLEEFMMETRGSYGGIGVRIIEVNDDIVIFETFPGSPAERAGLSPGDRIIQADGNELTGMGVNRAVELLRGPSNTTVDVLTKRPGADEPIKVTVEREEIMVTTVSSEMLEDGLGYIVISSFDSHTAAEFADQFLEMEKNGLSKGLILDLRNNPGGLVDQAVEVARHLVPEGEIVRLVGRDNDVKTTYSSYAVKKPYPIVVLINEDSASASELLAGALQDRNAALLVGKTTYGKASVQQLEYLTEDSAILLTVAKYFTPSGNDIDKNGVEPDFEVDIPEILRYYRYFHPDRLEPGSYGPEVRMLQQMLEQCGYNIEITDYFDMQTALVLSTFQSAAGLNPSGEFDDLTWVELREALDKASVEQDEQLNYALELISKPGLFKVIEGSN